MTSDGRLPKSVSNDRDLVSIAEARGLARRAKQAWLALAELSQEQIDAIVDAMAAAATLQAEAFARLAVEETGYGVVVDKIQKNLFSSQKVYEFIKPMKTVGVVARHEQRRVVEIAEPFGVVAAVVPSTNPTSTAIYKILIAIKARCAIGEYYTALDAWQAATDYDDLSIAAPGSPCAFVDAPTDADDESFNVEIASGECLTADESGGKLAAHATSDAPARSLRERGGVSGRIPAGAGARRGDRSGSGTDRLRYGKRAAAAAATAAGALETARAMTATAAARSRADHGSGAARSPQVRRFSCSPSRLRRRRRKEVPTPAGAERRHLAEMSESTASGSTLSLNVASQPTASRGAPKTFSSKLRWMNQFTAVSTPRAAAELVARAWAVRNRVFLVADATASATRWRWSGVGIEMPWTMSSTT